MIGRVVALAMRHPVAAIFLWIVVALVASAGVRSLEIETSSDSVLDRGAEAWNFYRDSLARFGGDENIAIAIEAATPYEPSALAFVRELSEALEAIPGIRRIDSLSSFPSVELEADGTLRLDPPLREIPRTEAERRRLAERVERDRIMPGLLASRDGRTLGLIAWLDADATADASVEKALREAVGERRAWISGVPVFRTEITHLTREQVLRLVPITVLVIALLYRALFGSLRAAWIPLCTSAVGTWIQIGAMGALGVPLSLTTVILPSVLLAMGCAYVTHLLAAAGTCETSAARAPLAARLPAVLCPIAVSAATTAIGFVSMTTVPIDVIRWVGLFGALGTALLFAATASLAPALLSLWPEGVRPNRISEWLGGAGAARLASFVGRHRRLLLVGWAVIGLAAALSARRVEFETDAILYFPVGNPIRDDYTAIRDRLSGISPMNIVIEAPAGRRVSEPEAMRALLALTQALEAQPGVGRAISLADPVIQLHRGVVGREELPESQPAMEQYLLLLESVEHLRDLVSDDRASANVMIRANNNGSNDLLRVARFAEIWWREHGPAGYSARVTGIMYEYARSEHALERGQITGLGSALASVAVIFAFAFRSPRIAAIGLIPNLVSLALAFGGMGLLGISLDAGTVFLGSLALGIAVDDTLHVIAAFEQQRRSGRDPGAALEAALRETLPPVVYTSAILALGFSVLGFSSFRLTQNLGIGTACAMAICVLAGAFLLPPLLLSFPGRQRERFPNARASTAGAARPKH